MFNLKTRENTDFVYLFEPVRGFSEAFANDACRPTPADPSFRDVIAAIYNCDFSLLKNYSENDPRGGLNLRISRC